MAVKRHGSKWRADWRDEFHIRRRKDFDLKAAAENHENDMRRNAREGKTGGPPACDPDIRLSAYAERWLGTREAEGIDPGTIARQEIDLRRHVLPRFGTAKVREIYRTAVRTFLLNKLSSESAQGAKAGTEQRKHKRLARGSVRSIFHTLSAVLSAAVEDGLLKANPLSKLWKTLSKSKKKTHEHTKVKALDPRQATAFLSSAQQHAAGHYPYFCTLMLSGLRPAEGLAVTADRIDFRTRTLLVDRQIGQHGGLKTTKTGEERQVDLSVHLAVVLDEARKAVASGKVVSIKGEAQQSAEALGGPWLFYPELGEHPTRQDAQRVYKNALRAMRRSLKAAGLPTYFGLHSLRHTYGSGLISRGVSPVYVQQQLGHESIEQTVHTYGSWFPVIVPGAVDALAQTFALGRGHLMDTQEDQKAAEAS